LSIFLFIAYTVILQIKFIKGAQWFVVAGLIAVLFFAIMYNTVVTVFEVNINSDFALSIATGIALSFPISLFFYLAFRFREINQEVVANANE
ncbi:hypothetical protein ABTL79_19085, partial [Acinetobacter baumannii]